MNFPSLHDCYLPHLLDIYCWATAVQAVPNLRATHSGHDFAAGQWRDKGHAAGKGHLGAQRTPQELRAKRVSVQRPLPLNIPTHGTFPFVVLFELGKQLAGRLELKDNVAEQAILHPQLMGSVLLAGGSPQGNT